MKLNFIVVSLLPIYVITRQKILPDNLSVRLVPRIRKKKLNNQESENAKEKMGKRIQNEQDEEKNNTRKMSTISMTPLWRLI